MTAAEEILRMVEPIALGIARRQEHKPQLVMRGRDGQLLTPLTIVGGTKLAMLGMVRAAILSQQAASAAFINEAWTIESSLPPDELEKWMRYLDMYGGARLPDHVRRECLMIYAEDDEGHWAYKDWMIRKRRPDGLELRRYDTSETASEPQRNTLAGMVPRRTESTP